LIGATDLGAGSTAAATGFRAGAAQPYLLLNAGHETTTNLIGNGVDRCCATSMRGRSAAYLETIDTAVEEFCA
jgi:hypothetical protein